MAIVNKEQGSVVIRIVYAGPPMAGKTESIRSLSNLLFGAERGEKEFYTPDDTAGRTLYFDWLNYVGGYFKGYQVNCHLISVPGQKTLQSRRKMLLEMADVVVFVLDSETEKLDTGIDYYREMAPWLERVDQPPVGVVIQANKRDKPNAASIQLIHQKFEDNPNLLIIETVATEQSGIREAFVSGVRIGLERATWLMDHDKINFGIPELENGTDLLRFIQRSEAAERATREKQHGDMEIPRAMPLQRSEDLDLSAVHLHRIITDSSSASVGDPQELVESSNVGFTDRNEECSETIDTLQGSPNNPALESPLEDKGDRNRVPNLPNKDVIAGSVFPPVSGRIILHKLQEAEEEVAIRQNTAGDWEAKIGEHWKLLSKADGAFASINEARLHLVQCAQAQQKFKNILSEHRCMTIVESEIDGKPEWRVWHVVRIETSLGELLRDALKNPLPRRIAERVYIIAEKFLAASKLFSQSEIGLPFDLETVGLNKSMLGLNRSLLAFIDFVPHGFDESPKQSLSVMEDLQRNFKKPISDFLSNGCVPSVPDILQLLKIYAKGHSEKEEMVDVLRSLFIGEC